MTAVAQLDFAPISAVVVFEASCIFDRIQHDGRSAAGRAHRRYEAARGDAREFRGNLRQAHEGQMVEDAVEAQREIHRSVGLRQFSREISNIELEAHP